MLVAARSVLVLVDFQERLLPAIPGAAGTLDHAGRLLRAARLLGVPVVHTEQNPGKLGRSVPELAPAPGEPVVAKTAFDATRSSTFTAALPAGAAVLLAGWEAHVCVLQTAFGLLDRGRPVYVVRDAVASRREESREAALDRLARYGAEIVTAEMAIFEWLVDSDHPAFREVVALVK